MKTHGLAKRQVSATGLLEMREVTFTGSPATMRHIARFLTRAADEMEKRDDKFNRIYVQEVCREWLDEWPNLIVSNSKRKALTN